MAIRNASAASRTSTRTPARKRVLDRAESLVGTPYKHRGRDHRGIDCLGLGLYCFEVSEDEIPGFAEAERLGTGYMHDRRWYKTPAAAECSRILVDALTKHLLAIRIEEARPGDLIALACKSRSGMADHIGILGKGVLIHATHDRGVVAHPLDPKIERRFVGAYRAR